MGKKDKNKKPAQPTPQDLMPMLQLQQQFSQVGAETPFGAQNYRRNPDGTTTLVTSLSPEGQGLVNRGMGLAGMDSQQAYVPQQVGDIGGALAGRVASRYGASGAPKPPASSQQMPPAQGMPTGGNGQSFGG